jgi:hypothetical protein
LTDLLNVLMEMRGGAVATDCNQKFNEVLLAVLETGKKGELTIKLSVKPSKFAIGGTVLEVETNHECKLKKPELAVGQSLFFVTKDGILTRNDPTQTAMFEAGAEVSRG